MFGNCKSADVGSGHSGPFERLIGARGLKEHIALAPVEIPLLLVEPGPGAARILNGQLYRAVVGELRVKQRALELDIIALDDRAAVDHTGECGHLRSPFVEERPARPFAEACRPGAPVRTSPGHTQPVPRSARSDTAPEHRQL